MKIVNMPLQNGLQGAINTALNAGKGGGASVIQRYFSEFFSAQSQYLVADSDIVLMGDFDIEFKYSGLASDYATLIGNTDGFRLFRIQTDGKVRLFAPASAITGSIDVTGGKQHLVRGVRVSDTLSLYIDGVLDAQITDANILGAIIINSIASNGSGGTDGMFSDFIVNASGSEVVNLPIDGDGSSNVVVNYAGPNNFARVNMTTANAKEFIFDGSASPNTWTDVDTGLDVIEVAGT
jgi:hypothetical protein